LLEWRQIADFKRNFIMERRSFLTYFSVGWAASCFPLVLSACSGTSSTPEASASASSNAMASTVPAADDKGKKGATEVGTVAQLDKAGSVSNDKVVVVRDPADKTKLLAVNPTCTHQGCIAKWETAGKEFACGCHGAKFAASGKVINGPATKPLTTYKAKIQGDKVMVEMA
jgi:cytochrome b6-f complex iron-sulfur subunit